MSNRFGQFFREGGKLKAVLAFFAVFSPAVVLVILVAQNAVNIPVWDGWERAALFEKVDAGTLTFADLYAPHIDHRMFFPRLIMIGLAYVSDGDLRFDVVVTFLFGLAAGVGVWKLARYTLGEGTWSWGIAFLANLWIFSPLQYDNWLWPIQISFMMPMTCLIWAIWVTVQADWVWWKRWLPAALLAIVGTHSFCHGLFIWPAVGLLAALLGWKAQGKWLFVGLWVALAAVIVGCYFGIDFKTGTEYGYGRPIGSETPLASSWLENLTENREKASKFFFRMLGGPMVRQFAVDPMPPGRIFGVLTLLGFVFFGGWALVRGRRTGQWDRILPWLALGGAVIAIAFGVATGRASLLAEARATVPRLMSVALYLPLSLLVMSALLLKSRQKKIPGAFIGFLIALQIQPWLYGAKLMVIWRISREQAQAHVQFIEHWDPEPSRIAAYLPPAVKHYAPLLDAKGWLDPPLVKNLKLNQFRIYEHLLPKTKGVMDSAKPLEDPTKWELAGAAHFYDPTRPADAVLITVEKKGMKTPEIIALADFAGTLLPTRHRIDIQFTVLEELHMNEPNTWMRWREEISLADLPDFAKGHPVVIRAWAYCHEMRKVYPMPNRLDVAADGTATFVEED